MRIINAHVHMVELEKMLALDPELEINLDLPVFSNLAQTMSLLDPESLIAQMDEAGIEKTVLFACEAPVIYSSNEYVAGLCKAYPQRFIGFASVNPKRKDAAVVIEKAILQLGLKGVKFHPPLQNFYPNDKNIFSLYKKIEELNVPVVFHIGTTPFGSMVKLDQANPILIDEVACNFPNLRIMLTHLGTLWQNEAFMVTEKNANVYIDTSAYLYEIRQLMTEDLVTRVGLNKFIFGTDYPMPFGDSTHRMKDFVDCINNLDLPPEAKEMIFSKNFESFMKPKVKPALKAKDLLGKFKIA
ncbi:MAG: amidohydrolase family protein [Candidatus Omnitrophica bacterium]|nr:amidohydrolase family protein [Candidatus Omnitrophota bacterium]